VTGDYAAFARQLTASGLLTDPWIDGAPRFEARPFQLTARDGEEIAAAAEGVAGVLDELGRIVADEPALLDGFFCMTPMQKVMWQASAPLWHGIARADVFLRGDGSPVICEVNCDTPSGLPEAICLGQLGRAAGGDDPNEELEAHFSGLVERFVERVRRPTTAGAATVGIVYPTELTEDLALISLYRRWCEARGYDVVLGSPFNVRALPGGGVSMFGRRCDLVLRHYKTDWWGERLPIRDDDAPYPDPDPLGGPLAALLRAELAGEVAVINPFGAVLPQNKRAFAFCWEALHRFSPEAQAVIRAAIPRTVRLEAADRDELLAGRADWVLKTDYGCEGEEVVVGREVSAELWADLLAHAIPNRWVAQRYFASRRDAQGRIANHGVFLIGGCAAGVYTRLSAGATDGHAVSVATVIAP
jgi:glutathionylspermidine synthase